MGATVNVRAASNTHPNAGAVIASTTTSASGLWEFTSLADGLYDVDITYNGRTRHRKGNSRHSDFAEASGNMALGTNLGLDVWQRGTGAFTANGAYAADRWQLGVGAGSTVTVTKETTTRLNNSAASAKIVYVHSATSTFHQDMKVSDGYQMFLGRLVTFSIMIHATAGTLIRPFISDGITTTFGSYHTGGSVWQEIQVSQLISTSATLVEVGVQMTASGTFYVDNGVIAIGAVAGQYQGMHPADELTRCQRYYEIHGAGSGNSLSCLASVNGAHNFGLWIPFAVPKGGSPTVTKNGTWSVGNCNQPAIANQCANGYTIYATGTAAGAASFIATDATQFVSAEWNP